VPEHERVHEALLDFHWERHPRTNALTRKVAMIGASMNVDTSIKCFFRDWFFIPRGVQMGNYMEDALFDVGKLPIDELWSHNLGEGKLTMISIAKQISNLLVTPLKVCSQMNKNKL
jgi:hypothetical protein